MQNEFMLIAKKLTDKKYTFEKRWSNGQHVRELTDKLFDEGYRFIRYVKNSEVDYPEFLAQEEERKLLELSESVEPRNKIYDTSYIDETESGSRWQSNIEIY